MSIRKTLFILLAVAISTTLLLTVTLVLQASVMTTTREALNWTTTDLVLHTRLLAETSDHVRDAHEMFTTHSVDDSLDESIGRVDRDFEAIAKHFETVESEGREKEMDEVERLAKMKAIFDSIAAGNREVQRLYRQGQTQEAKQKLKQISEEIYETEFLRLLNEAVADERGEVTESLQEAKEAEVLVKFLGIGMIVTVSLVFVTLVWRLLRTLNHGFHAMITASEQLACGSFEYRLDLAGNNEFGTLAETFNMMADQLRRAARIEKLAAIGQLAGGVAHDLRNPLGAIRIAAHYLKNRLAETELASNERVMQSLAVLDKEASICTKIISDLLDYTRARTLSRSACPLRALVADAINLVVAPPSVEIKNDLTESLPILDLDKDQLRQAFINLIQNAVEAIPAERQGLIQITAEATNDALLLSISDNGKGIAKDSLERIFEPLYSTKPQGTGLGLAIAAECIHRHNATIDIKSEVDKGTTFVIRFPRDTKQT